MLRRLKNWLLKELVLQVRAEDVFTYSPKGVLYLAGNPLTEGEIRSLQSEVRLLEETRLWKVYQNTLSEQAKDRMFEKAQSYEDMWSGKLMLKNLEVMRDINKIVMSWKPIPGRK